MQIQQLDQYISGKKLAKKWDVSLRTVERLRKEKGLPYIKLGKRSIRYPLSAIKIYEAKHNLCISTTNSMWGLEWTMQD
jgi:predicted DNA-binding transcriptional regulator AlpA